MQSILRKFIVHLKIPYIHDYLSWIYFLNGYYGCSKNVGMKLHLFIGINSLPFLKNKVNEDFIGFGWHLSVGVVGLHLVTNQNPCEVSTPSA